MGWEVAKCGGTGADGSWLRVHFVVSQSIRHGSEAGSSVCCMSGARTWVRASSGVGTDLIQPDSPSLEP